jgi:hypothetical protein
MEVDDSSLSPSCLNCPYCSFFLQLQLDEPTMENNATIICWVYHDDSLFPIEIDPGNIIGLLKEAIFAKKQISFGEIDLTSLTYTLLRYLTMKRKWGNSILRGSLCSG